MTASGACFGARAQVGESGWTQPLPLEGAVAEGTPGDDFSAKPVLVRARVREWGTLHEVVARLELVGSGFERTLVRLLPEMATQMLLHAYALHA